jgi:5-methylcytosine-specific restriction protein A
MPARPPAPCTTPGCYNPTTEGGRCPACRARRRDTSDQLRGTAAQRGYDRDWEHRRAAYLAQHPTCALCGRPATVADHWPRSRRQLIADHAPDPDAAEHLRPLCRPCHATQTAEHQPGGWARERKRPK